MNCDKIYPSYIRLQIDIYIIRVVSITGGSFRWHREQAYTSSSGPGPTFVPNGTLGDSLRKIFINFIIYFSRIA